MRLCRFDDDRLGVITGDAVADVTEAVAAVPRVTPWPRPPGDWLIANLGALRPHLEELARVTPRKALADVRLLSPVANPGKVMGAPSNYRAHVAEANADAGINFGVAIRTIDQQGVFLKATSSLAGPSQGITLRFLSRRTDYEGELAVVIGTECAHVSEEDAPRHVAGYCAGLDMTLRGQEERSLRKSVDSYTVLGPWLTTADEVGDPGNLTVQLELNGEVRQQCSTSELIFDVAKLLAYASSFYTLQPGDVLLTGTPEGVGPVQPGDHIALSIERVGGMKVAVR